MTADRSIGRPRAAVWLVLLLAGLVWAGLWSALPALATGGGYLAVACLRRNAGQCGVINEKGEWVVAPAFDRIGDFAPNGRAVAVKRQRPGVIDTRGEWVIQPGFDWVDEGWSAGLIKVGRSGQRTGLLYGLANEAGRLVVEPSFRAIQAFGPNRLAGACDPEGRCGFIDTKGAWVVPPVFEQVEAFSENGLAPARRPGEELWGYINAAGALVIPPSFEEAFPFDGDRAKVRSGGFLSLINSKGQAVGRNKFTILGDFDPGGLAPAQKETDGLFGLVNRAGAWAVPPRFEMVFGFNGGKLAPARQGGLFGFIDRQGQWVIKPAFGNVDDFESRGARAPAEKSGAWGLINTEGKWVVNPDHLLLLDSGIARGPIQVFAENSRWGLMDYSGRWLLEPILTASPYFAANGLSEAKVGELYGFIDRFGNWLVQPAFRQVGVFRPVSAVPPALPSSVSSAPARREEAEAKAEAKTPRRPARQEPEPTRFVLPDKPAAPSVPAKTDQAGQSVRPKPADAPATLPSGYIPPADHAPVRRASPARPAPSLGPAVPGPPAPEAAEVPVLEPAALEPAVPEPAVSGTDAPDQAEPDRLAEPGPDAGPETEAPPGGAVENGLEEAPAPQGGP